MNKKYVLGGAIAAAVVIIALLVMFFYQRHSMREMVEVLEFEKKQLADEYEDLSIQFDGYQQLDIRNDSLQEQLAIEQQRVHDLLEELRITKATNARRIAELKKELATVRAVMVEYVHQIDSLNRTNARLERENRTYRRENQTIQQQNTELQQQNDRLNETVTRASRLEIVGFQAVMLNKRDKKTKNFSQIQKMEFDYTVGKNITCERGLKTVYMRLTRPDGEVMLKADSKTFGFENSQLDASIWQEIEYQGDDVTGAMYWTVEEILQQGTYTADFFADEQHIGSFTFTIKK